MFDFPYKESYNLAFQSTGFESMYLIENSLTCFLIMGFFILLVVYWIIANQFKTLLKCAFKSSNWLAKYLFWSSFLRLFFIKYIDNCLSVLLNLTDVDWQDINTSVKINNIYTIIIAVLTLSMPMLIATFYLCNIG